MVKKSFCHFLDIINKQSPSEMLYPVGVAKMPYTVGDAKIKIPTHVTMHRDLFAFLFSSI